jgi:Tfp pilus assembly protein PilE
MKRPLSEEYKHTKERNVDGFLLIELLLAVAILCSFVGSMAFNQYKMHLYGREWQEKMLVLSQVSMLMEQLCAGKRVEGVQDAVAAYSWHKEPAHCTVVAQGTTIPVTCITYDRLCVKGNWRSFLDGTVKEIILYGALPTTLFELRRTRRQAPDFDGHAG